MVRSSKPFSPSAKNTSTPTSSSTSRRKSTKSNPGSGPSPISGNGTNKQPIDLTAFGFSRSARKKRPASFSGVPSNSAAALVGVVGDIGARGRASLGGVGMGNRSSKNGRMNNRGGDDDDDVQVMIVSESSLSSNSNSNSNSNASSTNTAKQNMNYGTKNNNTRPARKSAEESDEDEVMEVASPPKRMKVSSSQSSTSSKTLKIKPKIASSSSSTLVGIGKENSKSKSSSSSYATTATTATTAAKSNTANTKEGGTANRGPLLDLTQSSSDNSANSYNSTSSGKSGKGDSGNGMNNGKSIAVKKRRASSAMKKSPCERGSLDAPIMIHSDGSGEQDDNEKRADSRQIDAKNRKRSSDVSGAASVASATSSRSNTQPIDSPRASPFANEGGGTPTFSNRTPSSSIHSSRKCTSSGTVSLKPTTPAKLESGDVSSFFSESKTPNGESPIKSNIAIGENLSPIRKTESAKTNSTPAPTSKLTPKSTLSNSSIPTTPSTPPNTVKAIGLIRVPNHNRVACSTAVARARSMVLPSSALYQLQQQSSQPQEQQPQTQKQQPRTLSDPNAPRVLFPGAVIGRTSNTSTKNRNFIDMGIDSHFAGISRKHVEILSVNGLDEVGDGEWSLSTHSLRSKDAKSTTSNGTSPNPGVRSSLSMTVQVIPSSHNGKETNGVTLYRTRRGARKNLFLRQGQKCTLRVGDAMEFHSNETVYFCVVDLNVLREGAEEGIILEGAAKVDSEEKDGGESSRLREEKKKSVEKDFAIEKTSSGGKAKTNVINLDTDSAIKVSEQKEEPINIGNEKVTEDGNATIAKPIPATNSKESVKPAEEHVVSLTPTESSQDQSLDVSMEVDNEWAEKKKDQTLDETMELDRAPIVGNETSKPRGVPTVLPADDATSIKKHDHVRVVFNDTDCTGLERSEWYYGKVIDSRRVPGSSPKRWKIKIEFDDKSVEPRVYPDEEIEKIVRTDLDKNPDSLCVGDYVDCFYQNGGSKGIWYRGRVAKLSDDGSRCEVAYHDGEYETNIPTKERKVRLVERCDSSGNWLSGQKVFVSHRTGSQAGTVSAVESTSQNDEHVGRGKPFLGHNLNRVCHVTFTDGTTETMSCNEAAKYVFALVLANCPIEKQRVWPIADTNSANEEVRSGSRAQSGLRNQLPNSLKAKAEPNEREKATNKRPTRACRRAKVNFLEEDSVGEIEERTAAVSIEPTEEMMIANKAVVTSAVKPRSQRGRRSSGDHRVTFKEEVASEENFFDSQDSAYVVALFGEKKKANDFPPTLPNVLWCALNSPEADTGAAFLRDLLCVHNSVPPLPTVQKLMELMKFGPKADGCKIYFKDPHRTELASEYVFDLLAASSRLARRDGTALFGPSSFEDIEVLLAQSIDQTENMVSGRRLAHGLQLAARGAKLLFTMLNTELQDIDLSSTSVAFDSLSLKSKPTIKLIKLYGARDALKCAVRNATSCLVRHSRWILDDHPSGNFPTMSIVDESCSIYASDCMDSLGSSICYFAWLFCSEEGIEMDEPSCAYLIRDEFLSELERCLDHSPEMTERCKKQFVKMLKNRFLQSLQEEFAIPLLIGVGNFIEMEGDLIMAGL